MNQITPVRAPEISLVIPVFNEEAVLPLLFDRLDRSISKIAGGVEIVMVDDGSRDASGALIVEHARTDPRYRYIALSRNFGHQAAITAGMELARGRAVIVMDADLQDPPELILSLIERWREGYEIVHARRRTRAGETRLKTLTASIFYRFLRAMTDVDIPADVGDFRLVDRRAVETFRSMPEQDRFVRGMFGWMGYRQTVVEFDRAGRAEGDTKYPLRKMLRLALDGVVGFSDIPLQIGLWVGAIISLGGLLFGAYVLVIAIFGTQLVSGWASLTLLIALLSGANMLMTGIVGVYVGRTHREVKKRPLYVVARDTSDARDLVPELTGRFALDERVRCNTL